MRKTKRQAIQTIRLQWAIIGMLQGKFRKARAQIVRDIISNNDLIGTGPGNFDGLASILKP